MFRLKVTGIVLAVLVGILALTWLATGNEFFLYKFFAPRQEAVRRQVFEQSKAYNQGMIQELQNMRYDYVKADPKHQAALASIILHRAADFDLEQPQVPVDLKQFIRELQREQEARR